LTQNKFYFVISEHCVGYNITVVSAFHYNDVLLIRQQDW